MDKQTDLISRLQDEADLCRNEGASDIAALLDEVVEAIRDRNHDTQVGAKWREDSRLETWFPITAERLAAMERENLHLAREARTWWEAAQTYAKQAQRTPLDPLDVEELWDRANADDAADEVHHAFARLLERSHGIGPNDHS